MSDKGYKGKKGVDGDDYKPLQFYKDRSTPDVDNGFDTFSEGDEHFFTYHIDGEIVLISEGYASKKGRNNGVASVDKNRLIEARYKRKIYESDKHFFNLVAGNHQKIASSARFTSAAGMEVAIGRLMGNSSVPLAAASIVGAAVTAPIAAAPLTAAAPQAEYQAPASLEEEKERSGVTGLWFLLPILLALLVWYLFSQSSSKSADVAQIAPVVDVPVATVNVPSLFSTQQET
ncbi:MAG: hypothetical protein ACJAUP_001750 [Cellvibrionaceae bacterium]|jgi:uncharacterized protein YegP (UPF0339 family)